VAQYSIQLIENRRRRVESKVSRFAISLQNKAAWGGYDTQDRGVLCLLKTAKQFGKFAVHTLHMTEAGLQNTFPPLCCNLTRNRSYKAS